MSSSVSARTQAIAASVVALLAAVPTVYYGMRALDASTPGGSAAVPLAAPVPVAAPAPVFVGPRSQAQAQALIEALPEVQAWNEHLQKTSGGSVKGTLVRYSPTPKQIGGKRYWLFSYVANGPDFARRWENFLVGEDNADMLVDDADTASVMSLPEWRRNKQPMKRIVASAMPATAPALSN